MICMGGHMTCIEAHDAHRGHDVYGASTSNGSMIAHIARKHYHILTYVQITCLPVRIIPHVHDVPIVHPHAHHGPHVYIVYIPLARQ